MVKRILACDPIKDIAKRFSVHSQIIDSVWRLYEATGDLRRREKCIRKKSARTDDLKEGYDDEGRG